MATQQLGEHARGRGARAVARLGVAAAALGDGRVGRRPLAGLPSRRYHSPG